MITILYYNTNNMGIMSEFGHVVHDVWEHIPGPTTNYLGFHHDDEDEPGDDDEDDNQGEGDGKSNGYWTRNIRRVW